MEIVHWFNFLNNIYKFYKKILPNEQSLYYEAQHLHSQQKNFQHNWWQLLEYALSSVILLVNSQNPEKKSLFLICPAGRYSWYATILPSEHLHCISMHSKVLDFLCELLTVSICISTIAPTPPPRLPETVPSWITWCILWVSVAAALKAGETSATCHISAVNSASSFETTKRSWMWHLLLFMGCTLRKLTWRLFLDWKGLINYFSRE